MIESAAVMIVVFDISGDVLLINETALRITGYGRDEISGKNWFETVAPRSLYPYVWGGVFEVADGRPSLRQVLHKPNNHKIWRGALHLMEEQLHPR